MDPRTAGTLRRRMYKYIGRGNIRYCIYYTTAAIYIHHCRCNSSRPRTPTVRADPHASDRDICCHVASPSAARIISSRCALVDANLASSSARARWRRRSATCQIRGRCGHLPNMEGGACSSSATSGSAVVTSAGARSPLSSASSDVSGVAPLSDQFCGGKQPQQQLLSAPKHAWPSARSGGCTCGTWRSGGWACGPWEPRVWASERGTGWECVTRTHRTVRGAGAGDPRRPP